MFCFRFAGGTSGRARTPRPSRTTATTAGVQTVFSLLNCSNTAELADWCMVQDGWMADSLDLAVASTAGSVPDEMKLQTLITWYDPLNELQTN